jgi:hypothetical protein
MSHYLITSESINIISMVMFKYTFFDSEVRLLGFNLVPLFLLVV